MLFTKFASSMLGFSFLLCVTATPMPIPPELQPIIAAKNNLAGSQTYSDSGLPFNSSSTTGYSNSAIASRAPSALTYVSLISIAGGAILMSAL
ncbi:hypothetical protein Hypma_007967 [Hypsizygus marmoreus]|uniref:Uncharacterized protein n=1 Tax=Hypsizygus marmoreus TaxID=39966 RepID=A0A369JSZ2_HYPMA|nr:hypothetical protein Hypma_007967 [Hypsizygus marmoreus]